MKKILQSIKIYLNNLVVPIFGNTLGFPLNIKWYFFQKKCQLIYCLDGRPENKGVAKNFEKKRLASIGSIDISQLFSEVERYFEQNELEETHAYMQQCMQANLSDLVFAGLDQVTPTIEAVYGSYFQPYWIYIQRDKPGKEEWATSSDAWHIDDNPQPFMKVFFYLNNVTEKNGAFRAFGQKISRQFLKSGFKSYNPETRARYQDMVSEFYNLNQEELKILEGDAGTVLLFDNNLVHKGTPPKCGNRYLVQILIYPSTSALNKEMVTNALLSPRLWDYPSRSSFNDYGGLLN
jgi:hypothetical protein